MTEGQWLIFGLIIGCFAGMGWGYATGLRAEISRLTGEKPNERK